MITVSKEDYLKAILEAESEGETVISATLAHWLSVSPPAVTMALRRLKKDGLVRVRPDGEVELTAAGRKIARKLTLRHHLIERMLAEIFGMEWYKVHDEAERLEHAVSPDFEAKLLARLGRGGACPHGNLSELESLESRRRRGLVLLSQALEGKKICGQRHLRARPATAGISRSPRHSSRVHAGFDGTQLRPYPDPHHRRRHRRPGRGGRRKSMGGGAPNSPAAPPPKS